MKQGGRILFLLFAFVLLFTGCGTSKTAKDEAAYDKIQKRLINLESYAATGTVTYISNKNTHTYEVSQFCKMTGEYRVEVTGPEKVKGNITVCDGKTIAQFNSRITGKLIVGTQDTSERYEIFLTSFVKNYVKSQEVSVSVANMDENVCTVLEAKIPGGHPYLASEKLWVDNTTLDPVKLVIYDPDGGERVVVNFIIFEYNKELDDKLFLIN